MRSILDFSHLIKESKGSSENIEKHERFNKEAFQAELFIMQAEERDKWLMEKDEERWKETLSVHLSGRTTSDLLTRIWSSDPLAEPEISRPIRAEGWWLVKEVQARVEK